MTGWGHAEGHPGTVERPRRLRGRAREALDRVAELPLHRPQPRLDEHRAGGQHRHVAPRHAQHVGGLLVAPLSISAPEGNVGPDIGDGPEPGHPLVPDPRSCPRRDRASRSSSRRCSTSAADGLQPVEDRRRRRPRPGDRVHGRAGREHRRGPRRAREDGPENKLEIVDSPDLPPLWKVFGASRRDDGHWTLPELSVELASPDAALHIGPQHVVLEAAAMDLAAGLVGTDRLQMQSWHVMFLARGKVGPFRVDGEAVARGRRHGRGADDAPRRGERRSRGDVRLRSVQRRRRSAWLATS